MKRGVTGNYETTVTGGESVQSFLPKPLPPNPPLDLSGGLQHALESAVLAIGRLDGVSAQAFAKRRTAPLQLHTD